MSIDPTWDNVDAATFSFLEVSVGIIAVCLPTLRPMLVQVMPALFGSLLRSTGSGTGPTGGRASRTPFGVAGTGRTGRTGGGSSAARVSMFKGTLRESDSTEGLRDDPITPRSRMDSDIEFGELESAVHLPCPGPRRYSVSVVAGWERASMSEMGLAEVDRSGIKTTTVVTQKVSFAKEDGRTSGERSSGDRSLGEKDAGGRG